MKKIMLILLVLVVAASDFTGCQRSKPKAQLEITFVTPLVAHPVWDVAREGFEAAARDFGFRASYVGPLGIDPAEMVNQIEIALASGADGIITMPIAPEAMRPVFRKCAEQKIPVVFAGAEDPQSTALAFVGTNEQDLGRIGAEWLMQTFGGRPIRAHVMQSTMDASFAIKARQGYLDALRNYSGEFTMVLNEPVYSDMMIAMERYQNAITAHPEINALIGICGEAGPAAAKVVREMGRPDIIIIAVDDVAETLDFVRSGDIHATIAQNFFKIGYEPARILYNYLTHGTPPASFSNDSGCMLVTKDNINTYMASLRQ
jgi:ABC-type sugar transport system substrate-binding protein